MEDYRFDVVLGAGLGAQTMEMKLERFTLVGATTRTGLLASAAPRPLPHPGAARLLRAPRSCARSPSAPRGSSGLPVEAAGADELARRARGTPAHRHPAAPAGARLRRRWRATAGSPREIVDTTLARLEVDARGLDAMDRRILTVVLDTFGGGPVGIDAVAAAVGEERRHHRGRVRAVPRARGLPRADAARPGRAPRRVRAPRAGEAERRAGQPRLARVRGSPGHAGARASVGRPPMARTSTQPATNPPTCAMNATPGRAAEHGGEELAARTRGR